MLIEEKHFKKSVAEAISLRFGTCSQNLYMTLEEHIYLRHFGFSPFRGERRQLGFSGSASVCFSVFCWTSCCCFGPHFVSLSSNRTWRSFSNRAFRHSFAWYWMPLTTSESSKKDTRNLLSFPLPSLNYHTCLKWEISWMLEKYFLLHPTLTSLERRQLSIW